MKLSEIKEILSGAPAPELLRELENDERAGVQRLLKNYYKQIEKEQAERERFEQLLKFEREAYAAGAKYIAGVDEAGRGPLAGPLVIAGVILPREVFIAGLDDSKKLTAVKREKLFDEILAKALAVEVNIVSVSNIDRLNIYAATQQGMAQILQNLKITPQLALIDAMPVPTENIPTKSIIHGDALSASIAAASVIAKVTRDRIMERLDARLPVYGFAGNKGYGSAKHMQAIAEHGATRWHRRSYEPVKSLGLAPVAHEENILYSPLTDAYEYSIED